jgi:hypothetical protein
VQLTFPSDRIVGWLDWPGAWDPVHGPFLATGSVTVPDGEEISLKVNGITDVDASDDDTWTINDDPAHPISDLAFLAELPPDAIHRLDLRRVDPATFSAVRHLASGLRSLSLALSGLGDEVLAHVAELTSLTSLQTFGNYFTDDGVQQLATLTTLETLYLEERTLSASAFAFVSQLPRLKRLGLQDVPLTEEELLTLQLRLPGVDVG